MRACSPSRDVVTAGVPAPPPRTGLALGVGRPRAGRQGRRFLPPSTVHGPRGLLGLVLTEREIERGGRARAHHRGSHTGRQAPSAPDWAPEAAVRRVRQRRAEAGGGRDGSGQEQHSFGRRLGVAMTQKSRATTPPAWGQG